MNPAATRTLVLSGVAAGLVALPSSAAACAACFGQSDDAMARAMNMGILALLGVVVIVLSGFAAFAIFLARRSARYAAPAGETAPAGAQPEAGTTQAGPALVRPLVESPH